MEHPVNIYNIIHVTVLYTSKGSISIRPPELGSRICTHSDQTKPNQAGRCSLSISLVSSYTTQSTAITSRIDLHLTAAHGPGAESKPIRSLLSHVPQQVPTLYLSWRAVVSRRRARDKSLATVKNVDVVLPPFIGGPCSCSDCVFSRHCFMACCQYQAQVRLSALLYGTVH